MKSKYLRIILTNRCNLVCNYCHLEGETPNQSKTLQLDDLLSYCEMFYRLGYRKFKLMGGEPSLRSDLTVIIAKIRTIAEDIQLSMITNGVFNSMLIARWKKAGINYINVSLHGWYTDKYEATTGSNQKTLKITKNNIIELKKIGLLNKVNFVLRKGDNEQELIEVINWCAINSIKLDVLNVIYSKETEPFLKNKSYSFEQIFSLIQENFNIKNVQENNPAIGLPSTLVYFENGAIINLKTSKLNEISPFESCLSCQEKAYCTEGIFATRLTGEGTVRPCLLRHDIAFDLKKTIKILGIKDTERELERFLMML